MIGSGLANEIRAIPGGENLEMCYSCGTCTSKCMVQQKLEPEYNPRRLLRMVMMEMREESFANPTTWLCSSCDLCYPACPQQIHISGVITAVKKVAVQNNQHTPLHTAVVDQQTCVACGLCAEVCPYDAITIEVRKLPYRGSIPVAVVDPGLCMACGACGAACRSNSIGIPAEYSDEEVIENIWNWLNPEGALS
ncbi:MAG TPA: 4Fe-4S binding protein [Anaerolineaceae bacterium]|nr:4Fe-4S binding protein [Anaerolineaceae bacterium]